MSSGSSDGPARPRVVLGTARLAPWAPEIARVLGLDRGVGLEEAMSAALAEAGVTVVRRGQYPTFALPPGAGRGLQLACGRLHSELRLADGGRAMYLEFPLDGRQSQFLGLHADGRGQASIMQQSLAHRSEGLP